MIMCVFCCVVWFICGRTMGVSGSDAGWEYSCNGSLHFSVSKSSFSGKKGNLSVIICMVSGTVLC